MKVYIIVECMSGADHAADDPYIHEVCLSLDKAKADLKSIVSDLEAEFSDDCDYGFGKDGMTYEFTDLDTDEHGTLKIVEKDVAE